MCKIKITPESNEQFKKLVKFWQSNKRYYDILAEDESINSPYRKETFQWIPKGSKVLDIACGNGANAVYISEFAYYYGIDVSELALKRPIMCTPNTRFICGDSHNLPLRNNSIDVVVATYALEHFFYPQLALEEMYRVVREGGRLILLGPTYDLPFWHPPSINKRWESKMFRIRWTFSRLLSHIKGYFFKKFPFMTISDPEALNEDFHYDSDSVYVVWSWEVINFLEKTGFKLIYKNIFYKFLNTTFFKRAVKKCCISYPFINLPEAQLYSYLKKGGAKHEKRKTISSYSYI